MPTYVIFKFYRPSTGTEYKVLDIMYNIKDGDLLTRMQEIQSTLSGNWFGGVSVVDRQTFENIMREIYEGLPA